MLLVSEIIIIQNFDNSFLFQGATDQTSRRQMFELQNNFDHQPFMNGPML